MSSARPTEMARLSVTRVAGSAVAETVRVGETVRLTGARKDSVAEGEEDTVRPALTEGGAVAEADTLKVREEVGVKVAVAVGLDCVGVRLGVEDLVCEPVCVAEGRAPRERVLVGERVRELVAVRDAVMDAVAEEEADTEGLWVGVAEEDAVRAAVGVQESLTPVVWLEVAVTVAVGEGVPLEVAVRVRAGEGVGLNVAAGVAVLEGEAPRDKEDVVVELGVPVLVVGAVALAVGEKEVETDGDGVPDGVFVNVALKETLPVEVGVAADVPVTDTEEVLEGVEVLVTVTSAVRV